VTEQSTSSEQGVDPSTGAAPATEPVDPAELDASEASTRREDTDSGAGDDVRSDTGDADSPAGGPASGPDSDPDSDPASEEAGPPDQDGGVEALENEGDIAADYLEELLDIADLDGDLDIDVEGDRAAVSIVGGELDQLVGRHGEVLEALQELTRLAVYRETGERSRLMLDIGGYRADKRSRLEKLAAEAAAEVRSSGERKALDPMSPFERKVVHDAVAAAGLSSASEGEEPRRYVVVLPK
jgi:spoIIIJ-associated protein